MNTPTITATTAKTATARDILLTGHVQGVGFRPFVYRLAITCSINGWVENQMGQVAIHGEGSAQNLDLFVRNLVLQAPVHASVHIAHIETAALSQCKNFVIRQSNPDVAAAIRIIADLPVCAHCLQELKQIDNQRYQYPFINCTDCGPRYTIIRTLPYDRANTTMTSFNLCSACQGQYENPSDRRFHAEPIACPVCGPQLSYCDGESSIADTQQALGRCVDALNNGQIVAVKGLGGYHLMCDASNDNAVLNLRRLKPRPHKPLAVMILIEELQHFVQIDSAALELLQGPIHPIVLMCPKESHTLSKHIAPQLAEIGVMLPYSPLHHLILQHIKKPLMATSANVSGEPVLTDNAQAQSRLKHITTLFLHHNRPIQRPADDPVYRFIDHLPRPLRLGRGNAPLEIRLPFQLKSAVIATGGQMKNTVALAWQDRIVISPHIGDLGSLRSQQVFAQVINDLQQLYRVQAERIICDAHPGYNSQRWSRTTQLPVHHVYHHHAHASCLAGEFPTPQRWLVFTWDGVGFGIDGSLWGGEALLGKPGSWQRVASMRPFNLPGGERASREPWRSAAALCWEIDIRWQIPVENFDLVWHSWQRKLNCPSSSAVGRLFDAAAALTGLVQSASFEGQGPMQLEAAALNAKPIAVDMPLKQDGEGIWRSDWAPLLPMLLNTTLSLATRASSWHESLAQSLVHQALKIKEQSGDFAVGLSGGVFQNRLLSERCLTLLRENGFHCHFPERIPINDGGLCYGQVVEYHAHSR